MVAQDKHNPHLELTLSSRKKISSILEHLDRKWGTSSVASGELMLFPFSIQRENLLGYQRWSRESVVTAAEVYSMIGSPLVFRLRLSRLSFSCVFVTFNCLLLICRIFFFLDEDMAGSLAMSFSQAAHRRFQ